MRKHSKVVENAGTGAKIGAGLGAVAGAANAMHSLPSFVPRDAENPKSMLAKYLLSKGIQGVAGGVGGAIPGTAYGAGIGALTGLFSDDEDHRR